MWSQAGLPGMRAPRPRPGGQYLRPIGLHNFINVSNICILPFLYVKPTYEAILPHINGNVVRKEDTGAVQMDASPGTMLMPLPLLPSTPHASARCSTRLHTAVQGCTRLHTAAHGAHGCTRLHTAATCPSHEATAPYRQLLHRCCHAPVAAEAAAHARHGDAINADDVDEHVLDSSACSYH